VSDYVTYSRLHATLPAAYIAAVKARVRSGEPKVIRELWRKRDKTFLAIDFEWNERNEHTVMEWGYAALRCGHLEAYVAGSLFPFKFPIFFFRRMDVIDSSQPAAFIDVLKLWF
jgi:hypothetical protein